MKREAVKKVTEASEVTADGVSADLLWKVIQRYDFYIGTTNAKAAIIATFDTFVFGAIVIKWQDLLPLFGAHRNASVLAGCFLAVAAVASLVSLWAIFLVINPFVKSPKRPTQYHSVIFFSHVAEHEVPENYLTCIEQSNDESLCKDLGLQAHSLAMGVRDKFQKMKFAVGAIIFAQIPALAAMVIIKLWTLIADVLVKGVNP
jgi:hypothetical protein